MTKNKFWLISLFLLWFILLFAGLGVLVTHAADRYVTPPGGYGTNDIDNGYNTWHGAATNIQWAVNVVTTGDTVWVTNGNYRLTNEIVINTNNITLMSVNGRDVTFINGNYAVGNLITNRCITCSNADWIINGFTVSNGYATPYGSYANYGGGIFAGGTGYLVNCTISGCQAWNGGAIITAGGIISNCIFQDNNGTTGKDAIFTTGSASRTLYVVNCQFLRNRVGISKWGINGFVVVRNCIFAFNWDYLGATASGVGVRCARNMIVENCVIVSNYSTSAVRNGTGIGVDAGSTNIVIRNCIIYSNDSSLYGNWYTNGATNVTFYNNCTSTTNGMVGGGNITNWPMFVDYSATNYRLTARSPCVNTGTNRDWMTNAVDFDGRIRIRYGTVDMGAYENIHEGIVYKLR